MRNTRLLKQLWDEAVAVPNAAAMALNQAGSVSVLGAELRTGSHVAIKEFLSGMVTPARVQQHT